MKETIKNIIVPTIAIAAWVIGMYYLGSKEYIAAIAWMIASYSAATVKLYSK